MMETTQEGAGVNRLIIVGSPRVDGRSAALAEQLFEACIEECPKDEVALAPVATLAIEGCRGCDACRQEADADTGSHGRGTGADASEVRCEDGAPAGRREAATGAGRREATTGAGRWEAAAGAGDGGTGAGEDAACVRRCVLDDDMQELYPLIDAADELVVVSPVYFAGPPAQMKAVLDRLQPYFWTRVRTGAKRPAVLHVVGEGGDPHGFEPLVGPVRSALSCAGFALEVVYDWVGKIGGDGEILAEADERMLDGSGGGSEEGPEGGAPGEGPEGGATCGPSGAPGDGAKGGARRG